MTQPGNTAPPLPPVCASPWEAMRPGEGALLDLGANRGQFLTQAIRQLQPARALAVEMLPDALEEAIWRVAQLKAATQVDYFACAVGPKRGAARYYRCRFDPASSLLAPGPNAGEWFGHALDTGTAPALCEMRTVDDICEEAAVGAVGLLKADLQGFELAALQGATQTLARTAMILTEVSLHPIYQGQVLYPDLAEFLGGFGFVPHVRVGDLHSPAGELLQTDVLFRRLHSS